MMDHENRTNRKEHQGLDRVNSPSEGPDDISGSSSIEASFLSRGGEMGERIVGINMDITERRQAEEELQTTLERFYTLLSGLHSSILLVTDEGQIEYGNQAFCEYFGLQVSSSDLKNFSAPEMISKIRNAYLDPDKAIARIAEIVDRGRPVLGEEIPMTGGRACLRDFVPLYVGGKSAGRLWHHWDITERKQTEEALRQSEARKAFFLQFNDALRLLADPVEIQFAAARAVGQHLGVERAAYATIVVKDGMEYFQIEREYITPDTKEIVGINLTADYGIPVLEAMRAGKTIAVHDIDADNRFTADERAAYGALNIRAYVILPLVKEGKWVGGFGVHQKSPRVWNQLEVSLIEEAAERTWAALERARAEQALRQLNEELENRVAERTALAESRAKQLQSLAVELIETEERERRQFAHLLHDDLQQMLAAAKMQLESVAECIPSDPMLTSVASLLKESIEKSRRLSHELSPAILHQAGLIGTLEWLVDQMKAQFGLQVELVLSAELLMERTPQKVLLFRAVQELLFNIVKHAGVKSAKVEVNSSEDTISVTVSDMGRGFDMKILQKRKAGFGLLTIKERAAYIGGSFLIESAPGHGSRFTLTVPNASAVENEKMQPAVPISTEVDATQAAEIAPAGSLRVIFVDDHRVIRQGLMRMIRDQPAIRVVGEASNGREAIEMAHRLQPNLIVMDISMPVMDGIEATRLIKEELPDIRIIGLSMYEDEKIARSILDAGAETYLPKTASPAELVKAIYGDDELR